MTLVTGAGAVCALGRTSQEFYRRLRPGDPPNADNAVQDDYPTFWVHYKSGKQYLAWVSYQNEKDRILLAEREGPTGKWSEPKEVSKDLLTAVNV